MERLLLEKLHSPAARGFSYILGHKALVDALNEYSDRPKYQRLVIDFERGEDPDDAYSRIPYEKGSNFLLHLGMSYLIYVSKAGSDRVSRTRPRWPRGVPTVHQRLRQDLHGQEHYDRAVERAFVLVLQGSA